MTDGPSLPSYLSTIVHDAVGAAGASAVLDRLRPPSVCMTPAALSAIKSSRVSCARVLARHMIEQRWRIERIAYDCGADGLGRARYAVTMGRHRISYISRTFRWDGIEKIGRRSDGANRDMTGALFIGTPDEARIEREFKMFDTRDWDEMRTDSQVTGWTPGSRSARFFDGIVDALAAGRQPDSDMLARSTGYLLRNGGYLASGRFGTLSYQGYPSDHPFKHPYFADLFGLYMVRQISFDMVNGIARARNPNAAQLAPELARYIGVGNSSGQGMCVALQRWPHWVSSWVLVRELSLAFAKSRPALTERHRFERVLELLNRAIVYYETAQLLCEDYVVPNKVIAANLATIRTWVTTAAVERVPATFCWGNMVERAERQFDLETVEQFGSLLIEAYPEFADAVAGYLPIGSQRERDVVPEMTAGTLRNLLRRHYDWALRLDMRQSSARRTFWYHSVDNGEQRRGERVLDPHEEFESFIDHIGLIQRLTTVLSTYDDAASAAELIADTPELAFAVSRVQYLADLPYSEIRGNLIDRDFMPSHLIRFMLAALGMECPNPLSIRYVRGVFFPGMPLPDEIAAGTSDDWFLPPPPWLPAATAERSKAALR